MKILKVDTEKRRLGNFGERAAVRFLRREGYRIKRRNFVAEGHEIDVIAEKGDTTVFVEVKTRTVGVTDPREPRPASSVSPEKQRGIIRCAVQYASRHARGRKKRFDVIEVYATQENGRKKVAEIKHLINTFNRNTACSDLWRTGSRR